MEITKEVLRIIHDRLVSAESKLALISNRAERLEKRVLELEKRLDELMVENDVDDISEIVPEIEHESLLNHLIEDNLRSINHSPNHISLTIDLSKKRE